MFNCIKCDMNMWSDEILENKTCEHHFPYMDIQEPIELGHSELS